jgi:hypothetical protein
VLMSVAKANVPTGVLRTCTAGQPLQSCNAVAELRHF